LLNTDYDETKRVGKDIYYAPKDPNSNIKQIIKEENVKDIEHYHIEFKQ